MNRKSFCHQNEVSSFVTQGTVRSGLGLREAFILLLLSILFGCASLVSLEDAGAGKLLDSSLIRLRYLLIGTILLFLLVLSHLNRNKWNSPSQAKPLLVFWILFSFVTVFSGLANNDSIIVRDGFWSMIGVPIIFFNALPKLTKEYTNLLISEALVLGIMPYLIISLSLTPPTDTLYRGVFANPNNLGLTAIIFAAGLLSLLSGLSRKRSALYISPLILLLFIDLAIILLSGSRTSILSFFAMLFIYIIQSGLNLKFLSKIIVIATFIFVIILMFAYDKLSYVQQHLEAGFLKKSEQINALSGREYIWKKTFEDANFLGHGSDYFELNFKLGGHNTFIDILGTKGMISALLFFCIAISSILYSYSYFKSYVEEDHYAGTPLFITGCFFISTMGEGMFGSLGNAMTLAYMLSIGVLMTKPAQNIKAFKRKQ